MFLNSINLIFCSSYLKKKIVNKFYHSRAEVKDRTFLKES